MFGGFNLLIPLLWLDSAQCHNPAAFARFFNGTSVFDIRFPSGACCSGCHSDDDLLRKILTIDLKDA